MIKALHDRFAYAFIGFILGAVVAVVLWYLFDLEFSTRRNHPVVHAGLWTWVKYIGGFFAVVGFLFRDRVGDAVGGTGRVVYGHESRQDSNPEVPRWLAFAVFIGVIAAVWHFTR